MPSAWTSAFGAGLWKSRLRCSLKASPLSAIGNFRFPLRLSLSSVSCLAPLPFSFSLCIYNPAASQPVSFFSHRLCQSPAPITSRHSLVRQPVSNCRSYPPLRLDTSAPQYTHLHIYLYFDHTVYIYTHTSILHNVRPG